MQTVIGIVTVENTGASSLELLKAVGYIIGQRGIYIKSAHLAVKLHFLAHCKLM